MGVCAGSVADAFFRGSVACVQLYCELGRVICHADYCRFDSYGAARSGTRVGEISMVFAFALAAFLASRRGHEEELRHWRLFSRLLDFGLS